MKSTPKSPGIVLEDEIRHAGMSQKDFAAKVGVTAAYLSMLINGSRVFTENICRKLGLHTRVNEEDWLSMARAEEELRAKTPRRESPKPEEVGSAVIGEHSLRAELEAGKIQVFPTPNEESLDNGCLLVRPTNSVVIMTADGKRQTLRTEQASLEAGSLLLVESLESITLSENFCAQVEGLGEMTAEGLLVFPVTLPPGHRGRVSLTIKHLGFVPYELSTLPVARLRFLRVG